MPDAKNTLNARDYKSIKGINIIDDYTVQIVTKHPDPLLLSYVARKYMVPIEYTKKDNFKALATKPNENTIPLSWVTPARNVEPDSAGPFDSEFTTDDLVTEGSVPV